MEDMKQIPACSNYQMSRSKGRVGSKLHACFGKSVSIPVLPEMWRALVHVYDDLQPKSLLLPSGKLLT